MSEYSRSSGSHVDTGDDSVEVPVRKTRRPTSEWMSEQREPTALRELLRTGQAACTTSDLPPDAWFPETKGSAANAAVLVCLTCPVRRQCRDAGQDEIGVWAGKSTSAFALTRRARNAA